MGRAARCRGCGRARRPEGVCRGTSAPSAAGARRPGTPCPVRLSDFDEHPLAVHRVGDEPPHASEHQTINERPEPETEAWRVQMVIEPDAHAEGLELAGEDL